MFSALYLYLVCNLFFISLFLYFPLLSPYFSSDSRNLGKIYSEMIFVNGFVHCDPHPGNVLVRKCPQSNKTEIVLLDHGLYQVRHRPRPPQTST